MKVFTRDDIKQVRIVPEKGSPPVTCDVPHVSLFFFYEINLAILTCEIAVHVSQGRHANTQDAPA